MDLCRTLLGRGGGINVHSGSSKRGSRMCGGCCLYIECLYFCYKHLSMREVLSRGILLYLTELDEEHQVMVFVCEMKQVCYQFGPFDYHLPKKKVGGGTGARKKDQDPFRSTCFSTFFGSNFFSSEHESSEEKILKRNSARKKKGPRSRVDYSISTSHRSMDDLSSSQS
jgi:hypothetical protein